ncbi:MAG: hypothetical protein QOI66_2496, partial [Myxococcales bacterium]|nr:hypothetical protein [Myxococcales bacterium]
PPFTSGGPGELMVAHIAQMPPRPSSLAPEIPDSVEALIESMLAKAPTDRPSSMAAVEARVAAIRSRSSGVLESPRRRGPVAFAVTHDRGDTGETDRIRPRRLHRLMISLGAGSAAVLVVFAAILVRGPRHDGARPRRSSFLVLTPPAPASQAMPITRPVLERPDDAQPPPSTDRDGDGDGDGQATHPAKRAVRPGPRPRRFSDGEAPDLMTFGEAERRTHGTGAGRRNARPPTDAHSAD